MISDCNTKHQPSFPKGDLRRMLAVLGAISSEAPVSLSDISRLTGLDRKTAFDLIEKANTQADVKIQKDGSLYSIACWGRVINQEGALLAYHGKL